MVQLREIIANVAEADASVLIRGETGSGKEVVARELHRLSRRAAGPFVAINCGAIPESIFDSEMFGHEAGSFTGAAKRRIGKIEHASGGTLFLDEVDSMPLAMQVKLLRILQERKIERLGSNELVDVDIRLITASQKDLAAESEAATFRQDLYYRLNVIPIQIPSLRERLDDIPLLFSLFYRQAAERYGREAPEPPVDFLAWLISQQWPGNVRELQNVAERAVLAGFSLISGSLQTNASSSSLATVTADASLPQIVAAFEKQMIEQELCRNKGSVDATFKALKIPRKTLYDKFKKHGISRSDFIN
jgi:two-component system C4-dicarboxylate transport response regulator DctD